MLSYVKKNCDMSIETQAVMGTGHTVVMFPGGGQQDLSAQKAQVSEDSPRWHATSSSGVGSQKLEMGVDSYLQSLGMLFSHCEGQICGFMNFSQNALSISFYFILKMKIKIH